MHTCIWCITSYVNWQNQCQQCGGPLPPPNSLGPGELRCSGQPVWALHNEADPSENAIYPLLS